MQTLRMIGNRRVNRQFFFLKLYIVRPFYISVLQSLFIWLNQIFIMKSLETEIMKHLVCNLVCIFKEKKCIY